ncbi:MAG: mechanosensitive ion channel protein MscS, partial [Nitrosopumilaceae archaeon]|nr:mechanosensitive ion channel protein MscS [Nitrosopumilaceae archaeon]NIU00369.1 mechanosensitive ion channel protein MscS [Nitrosopumilaceae archaeon]NIU86771.1 mechanosensitive ion channel protein MscS [Nitrosopumilaceae archaeon]NIV65471.1 mechanosensitive ion channel protein MscS [Nitrosopumilaceae archaeon]NIX60971.1 mechanosensitive ion channel protein MscS [Nitrosopumilaceae archaeon]
MVEESTPNIPVGEFDSVSQLIVSSSELQLSLAILFVGLVAIGALYRKFSKWVKSKRFSYTRPHLSRFVRTLLLPVFAIALISTINVYVQASDILPAESSETLSAAETFAKILNTINMLVIGYTIAQLVPLIIDKYQKAEELRDDYEIWKDRRGFSDDKGDLFHKLYEWIPPKNTPEGMKKEEFEENLKTEEGRKSLEEFVTPKGYLIGTILPTVSHPYDEWKKAENEKYNEYLEACMSGNN